MTGLAALNCIRAHSQQRPQTVVGWSTGRLVGRPAVDRNDGFHENGSQVVGLPGGSLEGSIEWRASVPQSRPLPDFQNGIPSALETVWILRVHCDPNLCPNLVKQQSLKSRTRLTDQDRNSIFGSKPHFLQKVANSRFNFPTKTQLNVTLVSSFPPVRLIRASLHAPRPTVRGPAKPKPTPTLLACPSAFLDSPHICDMVRQEDHLWQSRLTIITCQFSCAIPFAHMQRAATGYAKLQRP